MPLGAPAGVFKIPEFEAVIPPQTHSGGVKEKIMASQELAEAVKEQEAALAGEGRVLVRASGTEALIRVMVEAKTTEIAQKTADFLVSLIKSLKF